MNVTNKETKKNKTKENYFKNYFKTNAAHSVDTAFLEIEFLEILEIEIEFKMILFLQISRAKY